MTRAVAAALMVAGILSYSATARGQPASFGVQDADPPPSCCFGCAARPEEPTEAELTGIIVAGATGAAVSQLLALVFIHDQPHNVPAVDTIPVIGTIVAAQRSPVDARTTPLLLFSAGVQAISILLAGIAGAELAARHRLLVDVTASPTGAGVGVTWRH